MARNILICWLMLLAGMVFVGCNESVDPPGAITAPPPQPQTPRGLATSIGDGLIELSWTVNDSSSVSRYKVYFSDSAVAAESMDFLDSTEAASYTVDGLVNGFTYYFRVTAVDNSGLEGEMSNAVAASPGIFSMNIESGRLYTNSRTVSVEFTAPQTTDLVQISEDSTFDGAHWESYGAVKSAELGDSDGAKYLYARFQIRAGGIAVSIVSDSIILDRVALIDSVTIMVVTDVDTVNYDGRVLAVGDTLHLAVLTAEIGGEASVNITGLGTIELNDFGSAGDLVASDGIYAVKYVIPVGTELVEAEVTGFFTDAAGNAAAAVKSKTRLNASFPPDPVQLTGYVLSSTEIMLEWTKTAIDDFSAYRLFRADNAAVDENSELVKTITILTTLSYTDTDLDDAATYFYRLYVYDQSGLSAASDVVELTTSADDPPDPVQLTGYVVSSSETMLEWTKTDIDDFSSYRLFRADNAAVDENSELVTTINILTTLSYTDTDLDDAATYFYRLYVYDQSGQSAASDSVELTTLANDPPEAVALAGNLTGTALEVDLSWTESVDDDFQAYHVLRTNNSADTVGWTYDGGFVINIINNSTTTTYLDHVPVTDSYYYKVFVFDEQGESTGSNVVEMTVP